jgi:hypothetical protein
MRSRKRRDSHLIAMSTCFCTLAIHAPYRARARLLCADAANVPWVVLTDQPDDFVHLPVRAIRHIPTGPMAIDYLQRLGPTGNGSGAAAYHDKRFAVQVALQDFDTAVFVDADSRLVAPPLPEAFPPGLAVLPIVRRSIAEHLKTCGAWRLPAFQALACDLVGDPGVLNKAPWCHETCYAVTKDGNEHLFFAAWERAATFLQRQDVYSGEGGVMGLAALYAHWTTDYEILERIVSIQHEGGGPKGS